MNGWRESRTVSVWRRVLGLSWPITIEQALRTLMRTTDVVVTGLFSPAAVAAVGLADIYARFPLRIGLGLGGGAIALSSQDTGSGATTSRDEAITQAVVMGLLAGVPFVLFGAFLSREAIAVLGASESVVRMGGTYLAVIFATSPARHVSLVAARSLQGTGDTRTPMYVNVVSNGLNIAGTVALGLGVGPVPRLGVLGVGLATAFGNVFTAAALLAVIASGRTTASFARPRNATITRQLVAVSTPRIAEGLAATVAEFPFNAILLTFGTEVNAAYQIGRRMYQQVTSPLSRGYHVAASVVVGQALGEGDEDRAAFEGWATAALGLVTVGTIGVALFVGAGSFVELFTRDPATVEYATAFARAYAVGAPALAVYVVLAGALQGGSDTRTPFIARTSGIYVFQLGVAALGGLVLGFGVTAVYVGIVASTLWSTLVVVRGFRGRGWADRATDMMAARGTTRTDEGDD